MRMKMRTTTDISIIFVGQDDVNFVIRDELIKRKGYNRVLFDQLAETILRFLCKDLITLLKCL